MRIEKNNKRVSMFSRTLGLNPLQTCVLLGCFAQSSVLPAIEFSLGEIEGQFDSTISVGASWRMNEPNPDFIASANGGNGSTKTTDDGAQNFRKGATFSEIIKGVHDLQLSYESVGIFTRGKYWYDFKLKDSRFSHGHGPNGYVPDAKLNDAHFSDFARFSGIQLLDAFVYGGFEFEEVSGDFRLGNQVLSWGESTFIQGGINTVNPIDVSAFRRPGAEVKEGLLPVNMVYTNLGLLESLTVEAFYQLEWKKTEIDGCGTYFSSNDFVPQGCNFVSLGPIDDQTAIVVGSYAERLPDIEAKDEGQYGFAVRWFAEDLLEAELGFYHINYHSRLPIASGVRATNPLGSPIFNPATPDTNPRYLVEFPEDIRLYGFSFATNIGSSAISGEISYRENLPLQINGPEILNATLAEAPFSTFTPRIQSVGAGEVAHGYDRFEVYQAQVTLLHFFENIWGASRLSLIGEVGATLVAGLPDQSVQRYGRNSGFGMGYFAPLAPGLECATIANTENPNNCTSQGYTTRSSWGYRIRGGLEYNDLLPGITFKPKFSLSHDVNGYGPEPGAQFQKGRVAASAGLDLDYLGRYSAGIAYTAFTGGDYNTLIDKDFLSLTASASF